MTTLAFPTGWIAVEQWATAVSQLPVAQTASQIDRISSMAGQLASVLEPVPSTGNLVTRLRSGPIQEAAMLLLQMRGTKKATEISPLIPQTLQESFAAETDWLKGLSVMTGQDQPDPGAVQFLGLERLAMKIQRYGARFPREEEISLILNAVNCALRENGCSWTRTAKEECRRRLSLLDGESLHYLRELAMVPPLHYLLVLESLRLLPTEEIGTMPELYEAHKNRHPDSYTREVAANNLIDSFRGLFGISGVYGDEMPSGSDLDIFVIKKRMGQTPPVVLRALSALTCYPLGHLRVAEGLGLIELPEVLQS